MLKKPSLFDKDYNYWIISQWQFKRRAFHLNGMPVEYLHQNAVGLQ